MSGRKGRSGGAGKIPIEIHRKRGTFRPARHGSAVLAAVDVFRPPEPPVEPPAARLRGLGAAGRRFLRDLFGEYELTPLEMTLAVLAAQAVDDIAAARKAGDVKAQRSDTRRLLGLLTRLGLPDLSRERGVV